MENIICCPKTAGLSESIENTNYDVINISLTQKRERNASNSFFMRGGNIFAVLNMTYGVPVSVIFNDINNPAIPITIGYKFEGTIGGADKNLDLNMSGGSPCIHIRNG